MKPELDQLINMHGNVKELLLPSLNKIIIRELNGEDDDIVSNLAYSKENSHIDLLLCNIIVYDEKTGKTQDSLKDIQNWGLRDKYFTLIASRIFSMGKELIFIHNWKFKDKTDPIEYLEDLSNYIWDYSLPFPEMGAKEYNPYRIAPYKNKDNKEVTLALKSGKKVKYHIADGKSEKYLMGLTDQELSSNKSFIARDLKLFVDDQWLKVESFKPFSNLDMRELRHSLKVNDATLDLNVDINNPNAPQGEANALSLNLLSIHEFFFPTLNTLP